jgi:hypothetical protein
MYFVIANVTPPVDICSSVYERAHMCASLAAARMRMSTHAQQYKSSSRTVKNSYS